MKRRGLWPEFLGACLVVALLVVLIFVACRDQRARDACRKHGGHVEEYDCRDTVHCSTTPTGGGSTHTSCYTSRSCRWRCAGLPAEAP